MTACNTPTTAGAGATDTADHAPGGNASGLDPSRGIDGDSRLSTRFAEWVARASSRPVLATMVVGLLYTALQMWWIAENRHLGAFDVDEAGGIAASLRFLHGLASFDPRELLRLVFDTRNGPLVPLLSVPLLVAGPTTVTTSMLVQPLLVVAAACGVAGLLASMGHRRAAVLGGIGVMGLSISIVSSRSYQYSAGVAAFLALAMWALAASDRGRRRWPMIGFGVAVAAMLLSRTMAAAFVPAVAVAALIVVARERRAFWNLGLASVATLAVAGPWWLAKWNAITDYLVTNAYGERAHYWGSVTIANRIQDHLRYLRWDLRVVRWVVVLVILLALVSLVVVRPGWVDLRRAAGRVRPLVAAWAVVVLGSLALLSTANRGIWFAHPLDVMLVAGVVGILAHLPIRGRRWLAAARDAVGVSWVAVSVATFAISLGLIGTAVVGPQRSSVEETFVASLEHIQGGNIDADRRLGSADADTRRIAAAQWQAANVEVAHELEQLKGASPIPLLQSVTGEIHLMNANTLLLAQEVTNTGRVALEVVNTLEPSDRALRRHLEPTKGGAARVLVIIDGRSLAFPDGRDIERFRALALAAGWEPAAAVPMPDGGEVVLYTHPDRIDAGEPS